MPTSEPRAALLIYRASDATVAAGMVREVLSGGAASDKKVVAALAIRDPELWRGRDRVG